MTAAIVRGDALRLPLADGSVDLIVTSPPYFALRSYRDGDEHYGGQIGSEDTPAAFLRALWAVLDECWRVLKPTGSCWVNLGDKYVEVGNPVVDPAELSALGVVQEVNRRLLHPLGMKLGWMRGQPFLFVYDDRDDPEGVRFAGFDLTERQEAFDALWAERTPVRLAALGYVVQPVDDPVAGG